jgi:ribosomal protein S18 acetylase RimI-like enzyme
MVKLTMIIKALSTDDAETIVFILRNSFATVCEEFRLTRENAPTNPAFIAAEKIRSEMKQGSSFFGLYTGSVLAGCIAAKSSPDDESLFYIERLAVLPEKRRNGYGKILLEYAENYAAESGGIAVSIGIMDNNTRLKKWYIGNGYHETSVKIYSHLPFTVCFMRKSLNGEIALDQTASSNRHIS